MSTATTLPPNDVTTTHPLRHGAEYEKMPYAGVVPNNSAVDPAISHYGVPDYDRVVTTNPPHSSTASTLASTSEFVRYFLLALPARYIFRGIFDSLFDKDASKGLKNRAEALTDRFASYTKGLAKENPIRAEARAKVHGTLLDSTYGLGSMALTASYSRLVYLDMLNLFSEAVAYETGKTPKDVTFSDLRKSQNKIVSKTVDNFYWKTGSRLAIDLLFFVRPFTKLAAWGDLVLGLKGAQVFAETWKREPTLFEHVATLVNNRINPKNGLGQPITVGDVFDLYQHYHFQYHSGKAFANVIENEPAESQIWSKGKVVFDRITSLLNDTYAYKHASSIDEKTGQPIRKADFALPKLIYLLGHDLIEPSQPDKTLFYIETANRYGMNVVREVKQRLEQGVSLAALQQQYPSTPSQEAQHTPKPMSHPVENAPQMPHKQAADAPAALPMPQTLVASGVEHLGAIESLQKQTSLPT